jgi:uncharacterized protein YqeY
LKLLKIEDSSRKHKKKYIQRIDYDDYSDIQNFKDFKTKREFKSVLNDEIKKVEEVSAAQNKFKRDDSDDIEDEEDVIILKYRPDPLTMINTPIQDHITSVGNQPVVKRRRILLNH